MILVSRLLVRLAWGGIRYVTGPSGQSAGSEEARSGNDIILIFKLRRRFRLKASCALPGAAGFSNDEGSPVSCSTPTCHTDHERMNIYCTCTC